MEPEILLEDTEFVAVSKPAGMIVNNADTSEKLFTLQDWVLENIALSVPTDKNNSEYVLEGYNKYDEFISRGGIVHRLDKETSGVVLIAKNVETFMKLQDQFKTSVIKKEYKALVHGRLKEQEGEINKPVGRLPWNRMRFGVLDEGRSAITQYKVISNFQLVEKKKNIELTYVHVFPKTGRTHQIRVHFQFINHPLFADALYAGRKTSRDDRKLLSRHFLHAEKIFLLHPKTSIPLEIIAPLSPDLIKFLSTLTPVLE